MVLRIVVREIETDKSATHHPARGDASCQASLCVMLGMPICRLRQVGNGLRYTKKFNLKDKSRAAGDTWLRKTSIAHLSRDVQFPFVAYMHLLQSNNPAIDKVAESACQRCSATTAIELFAVNGLSCIVSRNDASDVRLLARLVALLQHLVIYSSGQCFYAFFLRFFFKPFPVGLYIFSFTHFCFLNRMLFTEREYLRLAT